MASLKSQYFRDFWRGSIIVVGILALFFAFGSFLRPFFSLRWTYVVQCVFVGDLVCFAFGCFRSDAFEVCNNMIGF